MIFTMIWYIFELMSKSSLMQQTKCYQHEVKCISIIGVKSEHHTKVFETWCKGFSFNFIHWQSELLTKLTSFSPKSMRTPSSRTFSSLLVAYLVPVTSTSEITAITKRSICTYFWQAGQVNFCQINYKYYFTQGFTWKKLNKTIRFFFFQIQQRLFGYKWVNQNIDNAGILCRLFCRL